MGTTGRLLSLLVQLATVCRLFFVIRQVDVVKVLAALMYLTGIEDDFILVKLVRSVRVARLWCRLSRLSWNGLGFLALTPYEHQGNESKQCWANSKRGPEDAEADWEGEIVVESACFALVVSVFCPLNARSVHDWSEYERSRNVTLSWKTFRDWSLSSELESAATYRKASWSRNGYQAQTTGSQHSQYPRWCGESGEWQWSWEIGWAGQ